MRMSALEQLKWEFYTWCGLLSGGEIFGNKKLIPILERLERMLIEAA